MLTITTRPINDAEKKILLKQLPGRYKRFEDFAMMVIGLVLLQLIPLLVFDHFIKVESNIQGWYCIIIFLIAVGVTARIAKGSISNSAEVIRINNLQVNDYVVKPMRAVKREDFDDFGCTYYLEVIHEGKTKVLVLWDQDLDMLEDELPNTEVEFTAPVDSPEFINFEIKVTGKVFKPECILPAFDKAIMKSGKVPTNLDLLDTPLDEINKI